MSNSDGKEAVLENSPTPTPIPPIGSPILAPVSDTPDLENPHSVSHSAESVNKRQRLDNESDAESDEAYEESEKSATPTLNSPIGSPNVDSIVETSNLENQVSGSVSVQGSKRQHLGEDVDEEDDGYTTPTDSDHRIPVLTECPGAPRKSRRVRNRVSGIIRVTVSDEEARPVFEGEEWRPMNVRSGGRDDDVA